MSLDDAIERVKQSDAVEKGAQAKRDSDEVERIKRVATRIETELVLPFLAKADNRRGRKFLGRFRPGHKSDRRQCWHINWLHVFPDGDWWLVDGDDRSTSISIKREAMTTGQGFGVIDEDDFLMRWEETIARYLIEHNLT